MTVIFWPRGSVSGGLDGSPVAVGLLVIAAASANWWEAEVALTPQSSHRIPIRSTLANGSSLSGRAGSAESTTAAPRAFSCSAVKPPRALAKRNNAAMKVAHASSTREPLRMVGGDDVCIARSRAGAAEAGGAPPTEPPLCFKIVRRAIGNVEP
eukprot:scaffold895_cov109-Isochrysis_galbana.AAC.5